MRQQHRTAVHELLARELSAASDDAMLIVLLAVKGCTRYGAVPEDDLKAIFSLVASIIALERSKAADGGCNADTDLL